MEIFVGEFNEDDVLFGRDCYLKALRKVIMENPKYRNIRCDLIEHRGKSYYFRKMRVYLVV